MGNLFDPQFGPVVALGPFYVANLDTNLTNTDLLLAGITAETLTPNLPSAGTIVGISVAPSATPSAGSAVFSIHSASTELANTPTVTISSAANTLGGYDLAGSAAEVAFSAGARLGVSATTSTNLAATTVDYRAYIWVRFDRNGLATA